jgi:hypothetical protein
VDRGGGAMRGGRRVRHGGGRGGVGPRPRRTHQELLGRGAR